MLLTPALASGSKFHAFRRRNGSTPPQMAYGHETTLPPVRGRRSVGSGLVERPPRALRRSTYREVISDGPLDLPSSACRLLPARRANAPSLRPSAGDVRLRAGGRCRSFG